MIRDVTFLFNIEKSSRGWFYIAFLLFSIEYFFEKTFCWSITHAKMCANPKYIVRSIFTKRIHSCYQWPDQELKTCLYPTGFLCLSSSSSSSVLKLHDDEHIMTSVFFNSHPLFGPSPHPSPLEMWIFLFPSPTFPPSLSFFFHSLFCFTEF